MIDDLPSGKRIWELTEEAIQIEKWAQQGCSLFYELFVAELCEESDQAMRSMTPSEKRFFETLLREHYVKPDDRGEEWQSSYAIRCELRQELEGGRCQYDIAEMEEGRLGFEWEDWAQEEKQEVGMTVEQLQKCGGERSIHFPAELQRGMPPQQELGIER